MPDDELDLMRDSLANLDKAYQTKDEYGNELPATFSASTDDTRRIALALEHIGKQLELVVMYMDLANSNLRRL